MANYSELVASHRAYFNTGRTRELSWRREQLEGLIKLVDECQDEICAALNKDLHKHKNESILMEIGMIKNDAINTLNHLEQWASPQRVSKPIINMADDAFLQPDPYGVTLLLGAWNYPIQLTLLPLVGCLAAGNTCVIKPSEVTAETAILLERIVPRYLDTKAVTVVNGAVAETTALLKERWDYIFYTGNNVVAKIIYEAAAKHLTPVTLELGGKSPVYIDDTSDFDVVAQRLAWGKFANCGQTCIAPDYVLCTKEVQDKVVEKLKEKITKFYTADPKTSSSYGRIVNGRHVQRVRNLMSSGTTAIGGEIDEQDNYIAPTVLTNCKPSDPALMDEIFGPVLPFMVVKDEEEAIQYIIKGDKPLAVYVFSKNQSTINKFIQRTTSGGVCVNDTIMHAGVETLPFGGVGSSGMGRYHGKFSFDTYCHMKSVLKRKQAMEMMNDLRYPPYSERQLSTLSWLMKKKVNKKGLAGYFPIAVLGLAIAFVLKMIGFEKYLPQALK